MKLPPLDPGDVQDESGLMMYYTAEQVREHMEFAYRAGQEEMIESLKLVAWIEKNPTVGQPTFISNDAREYSEQSEAVRTLFCVPLYRFIKKDDQT
jgi:hypothetical protein